MATSLEILDKKIDSIRDTLEKTNRITDKSISILAKKVEEGGGNLSLDAEYSPDIVTINMQRKGAYEANVDIECATQQNAGAMSAQDKRYLDSLPDTINNLETDAANIYSFDVNLEDGCVYLEKVKNTDVNFEINDDGELIMVL